MGWKGEVEKNRWMEGNGERCFSDPDFFFFTLSLYLIFPPASSCVHILLSSQSAYIFLVFSSHPLIHTSLLQHPTSHLLHFFHLSFVPLRFCIWDGKGCFACHSTFASPFPIECGRERDREKRSEKEKEDWEGGREERVVGGWGGEKRGRSKTKRKDHAASWLNEHGQRMITIEYIMLLLVEAIN